MARRGRPQEDFLRFMWSAALGCLLLAAPLHAQETAPEDFPDDDAGYVRQVDALIDRAQQGLEARGYELVSREISAVEAYNVWSSTAYLEDATRYAVISVCDLDCSDVDLEVYQPDGVSAASDYGVSDNAIAQFLTRSPGAYQIEVRMPGCDAAACYAGLAVFQKTQ